MSRFTILNKDSMTIKAVIALGPTAKIIDIFDKRLVGSWLFNSPSQPFLDLSSELIQSHVIDGVLEAIEVIKTSGKEIPCMLPISAVSVVPLDQHNGLRHLTNLLRHTEP